MLRFLTATAAISMLTVSAPVIAKGHAQPADKAQEFGQKVAHASYVTSEDAKGEDGTKAVDGREMSKTAPTTERGADTVEKPAPRR
jgi:hypothetical protein